MSELHFNSTSNPENRTLDARFDGTEFHTDDDVLLRASNLGSIAEGLARAAALTSTRVEQPPVVLGHEKVSQIGAHLADFRLWEAELTASGSMSDAHHFGEWEQELTHPTDGPIGYIPTNSRS